MKKADLHVHSRVSDGSCTIAELAALAQEKGLDAIAVTDHETLSQAQQIPDGLPVRVIPGIEISACDSGFMCWGTIFRMSSWWRRLYTRLCLPDMQIR